MILIICAFYSFLGNSALLGPSVYISIYAEEFAISPTKASGLISYSNLAYGFGSLLLVPLYLKIGRRPVMLMSILAVSSARATGRLELTGRSSPEVSSAARNATPLPR